MSLSGPRTKSELNENGKVDLKNLRLSAGTTLARIGYMQVIRLTWTAVLAAVAIAPLYAAPLRNAAVENGLQTVPSNDATPPSAPSQAATGNQTAPAGGVEVGPTTQLAPRTPAQAEADRTARLNEAKQF